MANLLTSVSNRVFPEGVSNVVMKRISEMDNFYPTKIDNVDSFVKTKLGSYKVATQLFTQDGIKDFSEIKNLCKEAGVSVKVDSVETKYVADAEKTGSVSVYTITNRNGVSIKVNDINAKQFIQRERNSYDDMLQELVAEVATGKIQLPANPAEQYAA